MALLPLVLIYTCSLYDCTTSNILYLMKMAKSKNILSLKYIQYSFIGVLLVDNNCFMYTLFISEGTVSAECLQEAAPFLCLYQFPIFSCLEQQVILPTKEECERITRSTCRVEFILAIKFGFAYSLPRCNTLPNSSNISGKLKACNVE